MTMLMNPMTGSVDTKENWLEDYKYYIENNQPEFWFGYEATNYPTDEDSILSNLIEVVQDEDGEWVESE